MPVPRKRPARPILGWSLAAAIFGVLLLALWYFQAPTIQPADANIQATLYPPGMGEGDPISDRWSLEIVLENQSGHPLFSERGWDYRVVPYVDGRLNDAWDFPQDEGSGGSRKEAGAYHLIGEEKAVYTAVQETLAEAGIPNPQNLEKTWGFMYSGERYPARIRFYLRGQDAPDPSQTQVVYVHQEERWGRQLGWRRSFPVSVAQVDPDQEAVEAVGLTPDQVRHRALFHGGVVGDKTIVGGQVLLWQPEPDRHSVVAALNLGNGEWISANSHTTLVTAPGAAFYDLVTLNPPWDRDREHLIQALFGRVVEPRAGRVNVVLQDGQVLRTHVRDGLWLVAVAGQSELQLEGAQLRVYGRGGIFIREGPLQEERTALR